MTPDQKRNEHYRKTAHMIRERLTTPQFPVHQDVLYELRECQTQLNLVILECQKLLGITTAKPATMYTESPDHLTTGCAFCNPRSQPVLSFEEFGTGINLTNTAGE